MTRSRVDPGTMDRPGRLRILPALLLLLVGLQVGCTTGPEAEITRVATLGIDTLPIPIDSLARPTAIAILSGQELAVLDAGDLRVVVVDSSGRVTRLIGGPGEGPGEFQAPRQITALDGTFAVADARRGRLIWWTDSGTLLGQSWWGTSPRLGYVPLRDRSVLAVAPDQFPAAMVRYDSTGVVRQELGERRSMTGEVRDFGLLKLQLARKEFPGAFDPYWLLAPGMGDTIWVADQLRGTVLRWTPAAQDTAWQVPRTTRDLLVEVYAAENDTLQGDALSLPGHFAALQVTSASVWLLHRVEKDVFEVVQLDHTGGVRGSVRFTMEGRGARLAASQDDLLVYVLRPDIPQVLRIITD